MPPQALMLMVIPELTQFFTSVIFPLAGQLLKFTFPRIIKIPRYLQLLWTIYQDSGTDAEARKYLTSTLIILSSILTFMAYSYIPFTGVPIIGALTTPVAGMIAIVVILASLDVIFKMNLNYFSSKYPEEVTFVNSEIDEITNILGKSWTGGNSQEDELLAKCYRSSLKVAHENLIRTIAFPALGTGTGKFPIEQAAKIALTEVIQFLNTHFSIEKVKFVCFNEQTYQVYLQALEEIVGCESVESRRLTKVLRKGFPPQESGV